jgi:beta-glucuronidase
MKSNISLLISILTMWISHSTHFSSAADIGRFDSAERTSLVKVQKGPKGWQLMVDGAPFLVQGVCYQPTPIGESPHDASQRNWMIVDDDKDGRIDSPYQSWVDKNLNNKQDSEEKEIGDFALLQRMGCNTIRVYHHASADPRTHQTHINDPTCTKLYSHAPNKKLLRDLHKKFGIWVAMGDFLGAYTVGAGAPWKQGTDYSNSKQRENMLASVRAMVKDFKDEPFLLFWILGNENNYKGHTNTNAEDDPVVFAQFVNEAAKLIHTLDPKHPICYSNGETNHLEIYKKYMPEVDIFGLNSYRSPGFGGMWFEVSSVWDKPVLLTEYGTSDPQVINNVLDETHQASIHEAAWKDIFTHSYGQKVPQNSIGGFAFEWIDEWSHLGKSWIQDMGPDSWNFEWNGCMSQGNGKNSPFLRQPRKVYSTYQKLWNAKE